MPLPPFAMLLPGRRRGGGGGTPTPPTPTPPTPTPPTPTPPGGGGGTVDGEYPAFAGTVLPVAAAGAMVTGQSNAGFFLDDALALLDQGVAALVGVPPATFDPGAFGVSNPPGYGLKENLRPNPFAPAPWNAGDAHLSTYGGVPLYNTVDGDMAFPFLDSTSTGDPATWLPGFCGRAFERLVSTLTAAEKADCLGVLVLHSERDSERHGTGDLAQYKAARANMHARIRSWFGRPATGPTGLPVFWVAPHPYGGGGSTEAGHRMIRRAISEAAADPAQNVHVVCWQTADSQGRGDDYSHRDAASLQRFARMAAFGIVRVANSRRGIGNRGVPSFGPKAVWAYASGAAHTDVTVAHDRGDNLRLGSAGAGDGRGWRLSDNGVDRPVTGCAVVDASTLRLTHAARTGTAAQGLLSYCEHNQQVGPEGGVYDNFASRPDPAGWPAALGAGWKFDFPLRSTLVPFALSATPWQGAAAGSGAVRVLLDGADEKTVSAPFAAGPVGTLSLSANGPAQGFTLASNPGGLFSVAGTQLRAAQAVGAGIHDVLLSGLDATGAAFSDAVRLVVQAPAGAGAHAIEWWDQTTPLAPWGSFAVVRATGTQAGMSNLAVVSGAPDWLFLSNTFELAPLRQITDADAGTWQVTFRSAMGDGSTLTSTVPMQILPSTGTPTPPTPPTPTPPTPTPTGGKAVDVGSGADVLTVLVAQDRYLEDAQYLVRVDGVQVGGTLSAQALHDAGQTDVLRIRGAWGPGAHTLAVVFLNDRWDGTPETDRNLWVMGVYYQDAQVGTQVTVSTTPQTLGFSGATATFNFNGA